VELLHFATRVASLSKPIAETNFSRVCLKTVPAAVSYRLKGKCVRVREESSGSATLLNGRSVGVGGGLG